MKKTLEQKIFLKILNFAVIFLAIMTFHSFVFIDNYIWMVFLVGMFVVYFFKDVLDLDEVRT